MSPLLISIVILIPFLVIASLSFFSYLLITTSLSNKKYFYKKGTSLLKVDVRKRKFFQYYSKVRQPLFLKLGIRSNRNIWTSFEKITKNFDLKIQVLFSNVFHKLEKGKKNLEIEFDAPLNQHKKLYTNFIFRFNAIDEDSDYICRISWNEIKKSNDKNFEPSFLPKNSILESSKKFKSFIAFNIDNQDEKAKINMARITTSIYKDPLTYFSSSGFIVFVFYANSYNRVKKKVDRFINTFKLKAYQKGANYLFDGSAYIISNKVDEARKINKIIEILGFLVIISIEKNINFISTNNYLNKKDFVKYSDSTKLFRQSIKNRNIDYINIPVKSWKSKRKRIDFVKPAIPGINDNLLNSILRNKNNMKMLTDVFSLLVAKNEKVKEPVLINVNSEWVIENSFEFLYRKAIYVISFKRNQSRDELKKIIETLSKKGFIFALRINKYNEEIATFIQKINTKFIVIDSSFWGKENIIQSDTLVHLMTIKKIADQKNIKLIYENPSELINTENAERIGLKFFYKNL